MNMVTDFTSIFHEEGFIFLNENREKIKNRTGNIVANDRIGTSGKRYGSPTGELYRQDTYQPKKNADYSNPLPGKRGVKEGSKKSGVKNDYGRISNSGGKLGSVKNYYKKDSNLNKKLNESAILGFEFI